MYQGVMQLQNSLGLGVTEEEKHDINSNAGQNINQASNVIDQKLTLEYPATQTSVIQSFTPSPIHPVNNVHMPRMNKQMTSTSLNYS